MVLLKLIISYIQKFLSHNANVTLLNPVYLKVSPKFPLIYIYNEQEKSEK